MKKEQNQPNVFNWKEVTPNCFQLTVPCVTHIPGSTYEIYIEKRPHYCDRGDWVFKVDGRNDVDYADGFPRYFFGSKEEAMNQMENWLLRREAFRKTFTDPVHA